MLPTPQRQLFLAASDSDVLRFAVERQAVGQRVAVATLTDIDGPFSRPLGAQMAIAADGRFVGDVSNGCLESAVVVEALTLFRNDVANPRFKSLRYGTGSPFIDIQLPCGGGLDIVLDTQPDQAVLERVYRQLSQREVAEWHIQLPADEGNSSLVRRYYPKPSLLIAGNDLEIMALASLAQAAGYEVATLSQNPQLNGQLKKLGSTVLSPQQAAKMDRFTAVVSLFHDHEQELPLLEAALTGDAFYVGALGSRRSQAHRRAALLQAGLSYSQLARLHAPIGLIPRVRDVNTLAISALAEIAQSYQNLLQRLGGSAGEQPL